MDEDDRMEGFAGALASRLETDGYAIVPPVMADDECDALTLALDTIPMDGPGSRRLLELEAVKQAAAHLEANPLIAPLLPVGAWPVQCTLFVKSGDSNWSVTPHQDLSIPVRDRIDLAGWGGWSLKEGTWFVQPPEEVTSKFIALRLQLDGDAAQTGPLEVVPGSHRMGRLSSSEITELARQPRVPCIVKRGGVVVMRPLLIHSSAKAISPARRRVLHFLYCPPLPGGLSCTNHTRDIPPSA